MINHKTQDFEEVIQQHGYAVDVVLDSVGAAYWPKHARLLTNNGKLIVLGLLGGANVEVDFGGAFAQATPAGGHRDAVARSHQRKS